MHKVHLFHSIHTSPPDRNFFSLSDEHNYPYVESCVPVSCAAACAHQCSCLQRPKESDRFFAARIIGYEALDGLDGSLAWIRDPCIGDLDGSEAAVR